MKTKQLFIFFSLLLFLSCGSSKEAQMKNQEDALRYKMMGTWKCVSPADFRTEQIKEITADHFMWVTYDLGTKIANIGAGGRCSFAGNKYTESIDFSVMNGLKDYIGTKAVYDVKFDNTGNKMQITGTINGEWQINEMWERVESKP